jgi:hypothetical protein
MKTKTHPLRIAMDSRNLTLETAADKIKVGVMTIKRALRGEHIGPESRRLLCEYFDKSPEELGLLMEASSQGPSELILPKDYGKLLLALQEPVQSGGIDMALSRRVALQYLRDLGFVAVFSPLMSSDMNERIMWAASKPSRLDTVTLAHLESQMPGFWNLLPDKVGTSSSTLLGCVESQLQTITKFVTVPQPESTERRLWAMISELSQVAGQMSFDMKNHVQARTYYSTSIKAAQSAGNDALQAVAFGRLSFLPTYDGHPEQSIPFQEEARRLASKSASATTRAWLSAVSAEAYAHIGSNGDTDAAFASRHLLDQAELLSIATPTGNEDPFYTGFDIVKLHGYKGACFVRLTDPENALLSLQVAINTVNPTRIRYRSILCTDVAMAHSQSGDTVEACKQATTAFDLTLQTGSANVSQRLQDFRQSLIPWNDLQVVKDLDEYFLQAS